jgi:hypothetical protein
MLILKFKYIFKCCQHKKVPNTTSALLLFNKYPQNSTQQIFVYHVQKRFCEYPHLEASAIASARKPYSHSQKCRFWPSDTNNY